MSAAQEIGTVELGDEIAFSVQVPGDERPSTVDLFYIVGDSVEVVSLPRGKAVQLRDLLTAALNATPDVDEPTEADMGYVIAGPAPAVDAPGPGHRYACCGKVGRISRHEPWCPTNVAPPAGDAVAAELADSAVTAPAIDLGPVVDDDEVQAEKFGKAMASLGLAVEWACPSHGTHPHGGQRCLDCAVCNPTAAGSDAHGELIADEAV